MRVRLLAAMLALLGAPAFAQQAQEGPDYRCLSLTLLATPGSGGTWLHQIRQQAPEALAACQQGVKIRPKEGRMFSALGRVQMISGDDKAALESARQAAALGDAERKLLLGVLLAKTDPARALALFREAARWQHRLANYDLAVLWAHGIGVQPDPQDAANFMRLAALGGRRDRNDGAGPVVRAELQVRFGSAATALLGRMQPPPWVAPPTGRSNRHREDMNHKLQVRLVGTGSQQAIGMDAGMANAYVAIPWTEQDSRRQQRP